MAAAEDNDRGSGGGQHWTTSTEVEDDDGVQGIISKR